MIYIEVINYPTVAGYVILSPGRQKVDLITAVHIYGVIESLSEWSGIILGAFY
jgi:hypothetical protein